MFLLSTSSNIENLIIKPIKIYTNERNLITRNQQRQRVKSQEESIHKQLKWPVINPDTAEIATVRAKPASCMPACPAAVKDSPGMSIAPTGRVMLRPIGFRPGKMTYKL